MKYYKFLFPMLVAFGTLLSCEKDNKLEDEVTDDSSQTEKDTNDAGLDSSFTITSVGMTSVSIAKEGTPYDISLEYRKGDGEWSAYTIGQVVALADGETLRFVACEGGNENFSKMDLHSFSTDNYYKVTATGDGTIIASGNIMSLLDRSLARTSMSDTKFYNLFYNCTKLVDASNLILPATTLARCCYLNMFFGCTSLTAAPKLPAITLAESCYECMFYGCTSLAAAPALPATTLAESCYRYMFYGCTSLTTAPELNASKTASSCCYRMFAGCTSLITAPALPAPSLAFSCYYEMFKGCTSLTAAPEIHATTLDYKCCAGMFADCSSLTTAPQTLPADTLVCECYQGMFAGCSSLISAPALPATTLDEDCYQCMFKDCTSLTLAPELPATTQIGGCYRGMFAGCTSLTAAPALPAYSLANRCYDEMFAGCTSLASAPELPATTLASCCYSLMFAGCTSLATAPELPAKTLKWSCYSDMFNGCTSLTTAPVLPATFLEEECYYNMFYGCTNLNYVKALFKTTPSDKYTKDWLSGVSSTGIFVKSKDATWNVTGANGIPNGWNVVYDGDPYFGHEYVDLGLSVKWATMNVGANKPTDYGDYFAWGETTPYYESGYAQENPQSHWKTGKTTGYYWLSYKHCKDSGYSLTKYCDISSYGYNGFTDSKTVLDAEDDAATANWGGSWRMPTIDELKELKNTDNCTWTWYSSGNSEFNGVAGYKVISKKSGYSDKYIFLPAAGHWNNTGLDEVGSYGRYWSSSLDAPILAYGLHLFSGNAGWSNDFRFCGLSVRPVCQ